MTDFALDQTMRGTGGPIQPASRPNLDKGFNPLTMILFFGILAAGLLFVAYSIYVDVEETGTKVTTYLPYLLLMVALLIALGFEFVNGFQWVLTLPAAIFISGSLYVMTRAFLPVRSPERQAASVFSTSLIQYDVPWTMASSLKS